MTRLIRSRRAAALWIAAAVLGVVVCGCLRCSRAPSWPEIEQRLATAYPDVAQISSVEVRARLQGARPPVLLDVRSAAEYAVSHLPGARRVEPGTQALPGVLLDDGIILYCSVGERSSALGEVLIRQGYRHVADLRGGIFAWANADLPLERDGCPVHQVHPYDSRWGKLLDRRRWAWSPTPGRGD